MEQKGIELNGFKEFKQFKWTIKSIRKRDTQIIEDLESKMDYMVDPNY